MLRRFAILVCFTVVFSGALRAQDDFRKRFDDFTRSAAQAHAAFTDSVNLAFAKELQQQWERFSIDAGLERNPSPAPVVYQGPFESEQSVSEELPVSETVEQGMEFWNTASETSLGFRARPSDSRTVSFSLHGVGMSAIAPSAYGTFHPESISEEGVAAFWRELATYDYSLILEDCRRSREVLGLNDWAVLEWVEALAKELYPSDIYSERTVFTVFIMNQLGLMAKIARSSEELLCLFPSRQQVYARKYVVIDTYPYYLAESHVPVQDLYTYRIQFRKPTRPLDLRLSQPLLFGDASETEMVRKRSKVFSRTLSLPLDRAALSFYEGYPQVDPVVYATASSVRAFEDALVSQIRDAVRNSEDEGTALGTILKFVQEDFDYKQDLEQFGCEKPFFCEENFRYSFNDCEDRAALLVILVRKVLGLHSVLLDYPGHMAVAVELPGEVKGDYVTHDGSRFYVCDPSYIGAGIGRSMPEYRQNPVRVWVAY